MATIDLITKSDLVTFQNKIMEQLKALIQPEKEFITEGELIALYDFNKSTLAKMRMNGEIPYYKFGGKLFYKAVEEFQEITDKQIVDVQNKLNNRPRKILGYKTPAEVFFDTITKSYSVA